MKRIAANLIAIASIAFLPWWCGVIVLILASFLFDFIEIVAYGLILDLLYSVPDGLLRAHLFLIGAVVLYAIIAFIRPNLRNV